MAEITCLNCGEKSEANLVPTMVLDLERKKAGRYREALRELVEAGTDAPLLARFDKALAEARAALDPERDG